nr:hypothetical protein [Mixta intestinalis]
MMLRNHTPCIGLSRDTENANQALEQIFDREKEQQRLKEAQLIGEIGSQAADIARTQENIAATKEANERLASATEAERAAAKAEWEKAHPDRMATAEDISGQLYPGKKVGELSRASAKETSGYTPKARRFSLPA